MEYLLENKAVETATTGAIADAFDDFMTAFEQFKATNDSRLEQLETRSTADVVTTDKLARLDAELDKQKRVIDEISLRLARPRLMAPGDPQEESQLAHKSAFQAYMRKGDHSKLAYYEKKSLSIGSEADGGYLVPQQIEHAVNAALREESPIRAISGKLTISTSLYKRPFVVAGAEAGWVGEGGARAQTGTPALAELAFPAMELYAMPASTLRLLDDAAVDLESWLAGEVRTAFAAQESAAFVAGDGLNKPKGFLAYGAVANRNWAWGQLGYIASGSAGGFAATNPADALIDLVYALKAAYRKNARFVLNGLTQSALRRLKDLDGNYLWQPSLGATLEPRLLGYPVSECEDMPDIAAGSLSLAFGDFARGYLVVDRAGINVLRDPFTAKPYVLFYTTKRVGGGMQDFNAIKLLKFAAS